MTRIYLTRAIQPTVAKAGHATTISALAYQHADWLDINRATSMDMEPIMIATAAMYDRYNTTPTAVAK
ncbi:hypothetical protein CKA38_08645 [Ereboglobus luteus]|uniref:Uncharacterized protein n=1 Tax=Ereboglobus luteus TaxID=1796921 RepID=A0A2U8E3A9_9BACT|nr:hypothetical protein CKA38_08645 [Ereboglobus luteus]